MEKHLLIFFSFFLPFTACNSLDGNRKEQSPQDRDCKLTFTVWQKDAYSDQGGRNRIYLPVHSSTSLDVNCKDGDHFEKKQPNHGAVPGEKDMNGRLLLDEAYSDTFQLSKAEAMAFSKQYENTLCEETTEFLSLEHLQNGVTNVLYKENFKSELMNELQKRGYQEAHNVLFAIVLNDHYEQQLEAAYTKVNDSKIWFEIFTLSWINAVKTELKLESQKYHVCNNDANLSYLLWLDLKKGQIPNQFKKSVKKTCRGPILFFNPND